MPSNPNRIVLLIALFAAPVTVFAASKYDASARNVDTMTAEAAPVVASVAADSSGAQDPDNDTAEARNKASDRVDEQKRNKAEKKIRLDKERQARDQARDGRLRVRKEVRDERHEDRDAKRSAKKRMQEDGKAEDRQMRDQARDARHGARDARHEDRDAKRDANRQEMDDFRKRMSEAATPEERQAIAEEMKATRMQRRMQLGDDRDQHRALVRDRQEEQRVTRPQRRVDDNRSESDYASGSKTTGTDIADSVASKEKQAAAKLPAEPQAEQKTERAEEQDDKKPWWKFWGD